MNLPTLLWLATIYVVLPNIVQAMDSQEQEALTLRMCDRVIDEYTDELAFRLPAKEFQILEAEVQRCKELIDGYLLDAR